METQYANKTLQAAAMKKYGFVGGSQPHNYHAAAAIGAGSNNSGSKPGLFRSSSLRQTSSEDKLTDAKPGT